MDRNGFHKRLKDLINNYIISGYEETKKFPKEEIYGMTSQCRRALLSTMLNYLEGYGRAKKKVILNFYEISFGSLKETNYIFYLAYRLKHINQKDYLSMFNQKEEIAKMLWKTITGLKTDLNYNDDEQIDT